jgi:hypothetical protein
MVNVMAGILVDVKLGRLVCRDRESSSPYDSFALSGAVIVDKQPYAFARGPVAANETIQISFPEDLIWAGYSESTPIGIVLRGYDIDDNDKWREHRAEIGKYNSLLAAAAAKTPFGAVAAGVLKVWPEVVDQFVKWDQNDLLLNAAMTVNLPPPNEYPGAPASRFTASARTEGEALLASSWDYELFVHFAYRSADPVSLPTTSPDVTYRPVRDSQVSQWIGEWTATPRDLTTTSWPVRCVVTRSDQGPGLDVTITERVRREVTRTYSNVAAPSENLRRPVTDVRPTDEPAVTSGGRLPVAREFEKEDATSMAIAEALKDGDLDVPGSAHDRPAVADALEEVDVSSEFEPVHFETDVLRLGDNAALEIYEGVQDGRHSLGNFLRYRRPVAGVRSPLAPEPIEEMLHRTSR